jgi:ADP-ribosylglycohydrolase
MQTEISFDKAYGCLAGLALGDALGLPTEMLTTPLIAEWYGEIRGLTAIDTRHPHHNLPRGSVSDDTDQALLLAQLLIEDGTIDPHRFAQKLLAWSRTPRVRENNFLGKATRAALDAIAAGAPIESTGRGETIGAAMRVAPVALAFASREKLIEQVAASCLPTHNTHAAISGAMAVAFAVSAAFEPNATVETMTDAAAEGARIGGEFGAWSWTPPLDQRIAWAMCAAETMSPRDAAQFAYQVIGTGEAPWELIPSAFAILRAADGEPMPALLAAANAGGDTDTLGAIVGALAGALRGIDGLDAAMVKQVERVNDLDLASRARKLAQRDA